MPCAPQVQPAAVGERVGVALALLAVVLAVLVARAVAALAALTRERASARDSVVLVQMTAVPADPIVHNASPSKLSQDFHAQSTPPARWLSSLFPARSLVRLRSEERRVGKECRSRWS